MLRLRVNVFLDTSIYFSKVHDSSVQLDHRSLNLRVNLEVLRQPILHHDLKVLFYLLWENSFHTGVDNYLLVWLEGQRVLV